MSINMKLSNLANDVARLRQKFSERFLDSQVHGGGNYIRESFNELLELINKMRYSLAYQVDEDTPSNKECELDELSIKDLNHKNIVDSMKPIFQQILLEDNDKIIHEYLVGSIRVFLEYTENRRYERKIRS